MRIAGYALFYLGLAIFGTSCLAWSLAAFALRRVLAPERGARLGQRVIMAVFHRILVVFEALGLFRCDLSALDVLRSEGGMVIAPNHPALLDAVLVISRLPRVVCIMKASVLDNVFLGSGARLAGYIRNDTPLALIRSAVKALRAGDQLLVFPRARAPSRRPSTRSATASC